MQPFPPPVAPGLPFDRLVNPRTAPEGARPHARVSLMSDTGDDYRGDYKQAMDSALNGRIGFYADFDSQRQEEVWRLLSADRDRLLTFARRHAITIGKLEVRKTLKSPQPVYELIAVGRDARSVREYLGFERSQH
jgi:hypothetical protein